MTPYKPTGTIGFRLTLRKGKRVWVFWALGVGLSLPFANTLPNQVQTRIITIIY